MTECQGSAGGRGGDPERRRLLVGLGAAGLGMLLDACSPPDPLDDPRLTVLPLASLLPGGRLRIDHHGDPVELLRGDAGIVARSLLCTHMGCVVDFRADLGGYLCRCHQGRFDGEGRPVTRPPERPLRLLPVRLVGERIVVGP